MTLTEEQKNSIRSRWPHYELFFHANGEVYAKRKEDSYLSCGLLYTVDQTKAYLVSVGLGLHLFVEREEET